MADEDSSQSVETGDDVPRGPAKGPGQKSMTHAEKSLRDTAIVAAVHAGDPQKDIADAFGITTRQVRRVMKAWSSRPSAVDQRPMEIVERLLRMYEGQLRDLTAMAEENREKMPAVALGAMKAYADTMDRYTLLLSDIGKLPDNLELFRSETEMRAVGERMVSVLHEVVAGDLTPADALEVFERLLATPSATYDAPPSSVRQLPERT